MTTVCITENKQISRCNVPPEYAALYFNMTVFFVVCTNLIPSLFIVISNLTIINELIKKSRNEVQRTLRIEEYTEYFLTNQNTNLETSNINQRDMRTMTLVEHNHDEFSQLNQSQNKQHNINKRVSSSIVHSNHLATKTLIAISMSFLLLNVPYFVTWCVYTYNRLSSIEIRKKLYTYLKITEIFFLINYSIAGYLYFASGKMYREHLYAILGCTIRRKRLSLSRGS